MKIIVRLSSALLFIALWMCFSDKAYTDWDQVMIPNDVTVIEDEAFANCSEMIRIKIPESVTV